MIAFWQASRKRSDGPLGRLEVSLKSVGWRRCGEVADLDACNPFSAAYFSRSVWMLGLVNGAAKTGIVCLPCASAGRPSERSKIRAKSIASFSVKALCPAT